jgi:cysteine desulfurase
MPRIYLDHNATFPPFPEAVRAMQGWLEGFGNPSSVHWHGRRARAALEEARARVAALCGGRPAEIVLTSGATEANALALRGALDAAGGGDLVISAIEHPSVAATAEWLEGRGVGRTRVGVGREGRVDPAAVAAALGPRTVLVSVMLANHETGVVQPIREIAAAARRAGALVHTDAAQAAGRVPIDAEALGVDLLTLSAHKLGGPPGVGALWVRPGTPLAPLLHGGGQEAGRRAGTENLAGAVGFGAAARVAADLARDGAAVAALRDRLETGLCAAWPGAVVHGRGAARLPNTACLGFPGLDGEAAVMRLDLEGIAASLGSACASGSMRPSPVLLAMGAGEDLARASLRFSLGPRTTRAEIDRTVEVFERCVAPARAPAVMEGA